LVVGHVLRLAELHGGFLVVESEPAVGTTVIVRIPATTPV